MEMRNNRIERGLYVSLLVLLGIFIILASFKKQRWDTDIFWALKTGEWILTHMSVPETDPFSYTFAGKEWIDFTWGFQVIAHIFYTYLGGWWGLFVLQCLIISATFLVLFLLIRTIAGDRYWLIASLLYITFAIAVDRFFIRPHLFGYLFVASYFYIFTLSERKGAVRYLLLLPLLQVLWTNIHSSFILGIFISGVWAFGSWVDHCREEGRLTPPPPQTWLYGGITLLLFGTSFINPYGWKLVFFPFIHQMGENREALRYIQEWQSVPVDKFFFELYPFPLSIFYLKLAVALSIVAMLINLGWMRTRDVLFVAVALYMALKHIRWTALFPLFSICLMATNISEYLERRFTGKTRLKPLMVFITIFSVAILLYNFSIRDNKDYGLGMKKGKFPEGTVRFIKALNMEGNVYNQYVYGGYLIYNDIKVFIDGRTPTLYDPLFFWKTRIAETRNRWKRLVEDYSIDMVLIEKDNSLCRKLHGDENWRAVMFDDASVLYLKTERFPHIVEEWGIKHLNPCLVSMGYVLPDEKDKLKIAEAEAKRVLRFYSKNLPERVALPYRLLGLVYLKLGGEYLESAVPLFKKALSIQDDPHTRNNLGVALFRLKRYEPATREFTQSMGSVTESYLFLAMISYEQKDYNGALQYSEGYIKRAKTPKANAYRIAGLACFEMADYRCAVRYLEQAGFLAEDNIDLAELYYYLASAYMELEDYNRAQLYYSRAITIRKDYRERLLKLLEILKSRGENQKAERLHRLLTPLL